MTPAKSRIVKPSTKTSILAVALWKNVMSQTEYVLFQRRLEADYDATARFAPSFLPTESSRYVMPDLARSMRVSRHGIIRKLVGDGRGRRRIWTWGKNFYFQPSIHSSPFWTEFLQANTRRGQESMLRRSRAEFL